MAWLRSGIGMPKKIGPSNYQEAARPRTWQMGDGVVWPVAAFAVLGFLGWIRGWTSARKVDAMEQRLRALEQGQSATAVAR